MKKDPIEIGREVLEIEIQALKDLSESLDYNFKKACECLYLTKGRVILSGIGKSGIIGKKIAATLTSLGTPAIFLHPTESLHGDLGIISKDDVFIGISKSGESDEFRMLIPLVKRIGVPVIAITSSLNSELAQLADIILHVPIEREACPYDMAPTSSSTAMLALGDALAICVMNMKGVKLEEFAAYHPGGSIGKRLWLRVEDMMLTEEEHVPMVREDASMQEVILEMTRKRGITSVVSEDGQLLGVFTDGDLRRLLEKKGGNLFKLKAKDVMNPEPKVIGPGQLAVEAARKMEKYGVTALIVVDNRKKVIGIIHLHDLMKAKVV